MTLLDNALIQKYFGWDGLPEEAKKQFKRDNWNPYALEAVNVLQAMQQPIKRGERYLVTHDDRNWEESVRTTDWLPSDSPFHPLELRLPDRFQEKECETTYYTCSAENCPCISHKPASEPCVPSQQAISDIARAELHKGIFKKPEPEKCGQCEVHGGGDCPPYQPASEPEKCDGKNEHVGYCCQPASAVEEKIRELIEKYLPWRRDIPVDTATWASDLRALVKLARGER